MKRITLAVLVAIALVASFYFGLKIGAQEEYFGASQYRAAVVASKLRRLEQGQDLRSGLEFDLDSEILDYNTYLESTWSWLFPELQPHPHGIGAAAAYRASHRLAGQAPIGLESKKDLQRVVDLYANMQ
jgi:hypothetical protein